jgi:hypothetical protein
MKHRVISMSCLCLLFNALPLYGDLITLKTNSSRYGHVLYNSNNKQFTVTSTTNGKPDPPYLIPRDQVASVDFNSEENNPSEPGTHDKFGSFRKLSTAQVNQLNAVMDRMPLNSETEKIAYSDKLKKTNSPDQQACHLDDINAGTVYYRVEKADKTGENRSAMRKDVATIVIGD